MKPTTNSWKEKGQTQTKVIVAVVVIVLIIAAGLVYFFGLRGSGQAVYTQAEGIPGSAGFNGQLSDLLNKQSFNLVIASHLGKEQASEFYFELVYPEGFKVTGSLRNNPFGASQDQTLYLREETVREGAFWKTTVHTATLDPSKIIQGANVILGIIPISYTGPMNPTEAQLRQIRFTTFTIPPLSNPSGNIVQQIRNIADEPSTQQCPPQQDCNAWYELNKENLCSQWLNGVDLNSKLTPEQKQALCGPVTPPVQCTAEQCRTDFNFITRDECANNGGECPPVDIAGVTQFCQNNDCTQLCTAVPGLCNAGQVTFNADLNGDNLIDDRDALFIFQAIEAKQSAYGFCGAVGEAPCVFNDRAICEDVSYVWTAGAGKDQRVNLVQLPVLPTPDSSNALHAQNIRCGNLRGGQ